ncbi:NYN domain-containing protein [Amycolatopsis sp. WAC 01375]|nr:NYN domain-containing protein [Amycolatopsis sp. WAC 01375]
MFGRWDPPGHRAQQAALLIDFENVVLGAGSTLPDRYEPVPAAALAWLCRAYGPTTTRRAYADWADPRFGRYQQMLERSGVDLVQLGHGPSRKNGADIRMTVDAMETLIVHPSVDAFVLASGDSDFSPLVSKLREFGKYVIGVGAETSASARLVSVCSEYQLWGSIVEETAPRPEAPHTASHPVHRLADAEALVVAAMQESPTSAPTASWLKSKMRALDPAFAEADFGCASFRELLGQLEHRVRAVGRSGGDITLSLIEPAEPLMASSTTG